MKYEKSHIKTDRNGNQWLVDCNGTYLRDENGDKISPQHYKMKEFRTSSFTAYDTSKGHCGLCGKISCRGQCFK